MACFIGVSALATRLTHRLTGVRLSDPMSGFFMMRRDRFDAIAPRLSPVGFKILLDIAMTAGERLRIAEVAIEWHYRRESQINMVRDGFAMLREVLRIRARAIRGMYR